MKRPVQVVDFRLARLVAEADKLYSAQPQNERLQDLCCLVRGYTALYYDYLTASFPWAHVMDLVFQMRQAGEKVTQAAPEDEITC